MARVTLTRTTVPGPYVTLQPAVDTLDLTMTAGDAANLNQFVIDGPMILVAHNTGVGARTITLESVADASLRTGNITAYSIGAGEIFAYKLDSTIGWRQTDGFFYVTVSHAEVKLGIIRY